jgi:hypothetical protein
LIINPVIICLFNFVKTEGKKPVVRCTHNRKILIEMHGKIWEDVPWMDLAEHEIHFPVLLKMMVNPGIPQRTGHFLASLSAVIS